MANYDSSHTGATIDSAVSQITDASTDLNVDSNSLVVDKSANNVGIGVTAPGGIANGLSLVPDLEIRGAAGSGAACAGVLALTTAETSTVDGDVQGAIVFQSPVDGSGTDAILSGAAIWAEADATFSSSVNNTELVFATNTSAAATERMRIEAGGTVSIAGDLAVTGDQTLSGDLIMADGKGIDFAADASPSAGMTAEILDDYEEGTWTAQLADGSSNNMVMSDDTGYYTKVGNLVTVSGYFTTTSLGSASGAIRITGLPFTVANNSAAYSGGAAGYGNGLDIIAGHTVSIYGQANDTYIHLQVWDATTGPTSMLASEWSANGQIILGFSYRAA
jgi:hypothetical protein